MLSPAQCYGIINGASTNKIHHESSHRICSAYYLFDYDKATLIRISGKFNPCHPGKIEAVSTSERITIDIKDHRSQIGFCVRLDLCFVSLTSARLQDQKSAKGEGCNEYADQQPRNACHSSQWAKAATIWPDRECAERIDYAIATMHSNVRAQEGTEHTRISAKSLAAISKPCPILLYKLRFGIIPLLHISPSTCLANLHNRIKIKHSFSLASMSTTAAMHRGTTLFV